MNFSHLRNALVVLGVILLSGCAGALHTAAKQNDVPRAKMLIESGVQVDCRAKWKNETPLQMAAEAGNTEVVKFLIDAGADVNAGGYNNFTVLHSAITSGNEDVVRLLLENGANVNAVTDEEYAPIHHAAYHGNANIIRLLINYGADLTLKDRWINNMTPYELASVRNHDSVVLNLLRIEDQKASAASAGMDVNPESIASEMSEKKYAVDERRPYVVLAAERGQYKVLQGLIENGVDVNTVLPDGSTALMLAAKRGHDDIVKLLLRHGADVNVERNDGENAMSLAASEEIREILRSFGAQ